MGRVPEPPIAEPTSLGCDVETEDLNERVPEEAACDEELQPVQGQVVPSKTKWRQAAAGYIAKGWPMSQQYTFIPIYIYIDYIS